MDKTKQLGLRLKIKLYNAARAATEASKISFSDLFEKILIFFLNNQKMVLEFQEVNAMEKEFLELAKTPGWSLKRIMSQGITTRGQLYWAAQLLQKAWHLSEGTATAAWVVNVVKALRLILRMEIRNGEELKPYLLSSFPEQGSDLEEKIENALVRLKEKSRVSTIIADQIAGCFLVIVRDGDFEISAANMIALNDLLSPWIYWVMRRAIQDKTDLRVIDTGPLLSHEPAKERSFSGEKSYVSVKGLFSSEGDPPLFAGKQPFSCVFSFHPNNKLRERVPCSAQTLYELVETANIINRENKILAGFGHWEIMKDDKNSAYTIEKDTRIYVSKEEMEEFLELVDELYKREDVQRELVKSYAEVYGAI
jgi:hypothetical protein